MELLSQFHGLFIRIFYGDHPAINIEHFFKSVISFICQNHIAIGLYLLDAIVLLPLQIKLSGLSKGQPFG